MNLNIDLAYQATLWRNKTLPNNTRRKYMKEVNKWFCFGKLLKAALNII